MPRSLIVEILGEATQFAAELDKAAGKTRSLGKVAGVAGLAIAGGLAYGLEKSVEAASAAQQSTARLDAAFKTSGQSATAYKGQIEDAEASNRKLGFTNTETADSLGSLEIATHNGAQAIKDLGTAADIARFKHIGLTDASKMLTMAMSGSQRATKQLGITIQPLTHNYDLLKQHYADLKEKIPPAEAATAKFADKQATAAEVIDTVNQKLHGQADAYANTAAGGMAQFHAQVDAIEEKLGNALLPALTKVAGALADGASWLSQHATVAKVLVGVLGALAAILITVSVAQKIAAAAQVLLNVAMDANPIGIIVLALAALAVGLIYAWKHSETFRDIVKGAFADVKAAGEWIVQTAETIWHAFEKAIAWVRANWPLLVGILTGPIGLAVEQIVTHWHAITSTLSNVLDDVVGFFRALPGKIVHALGDLAHLLYDAGSQVVQGLLDGIESKAKDLYGKAQGLMDHVKGMFSFHWGSTPQEWGTTIGAALSQGIGDGMAQNHAPATSAATALAEHTKVAMLGGFSGMDHMASAAIQTQLFKAMDIAQPSLEAQMRKMLADTTAAAVAGWTMLTDAQAALNAKQTADQNAATLQQYQDTFVDTQFAGKGYNVGMSAAEVYALQAPTVVVNVAGSVSTQQDLVKSVQAGLAQTQSRNVTTGIH